MSSRTGFFVVIFLLGFSWSYQYNRYSPDKETKRAWKAAREIGKTPGYNIVLAINADGKEIGRRPYSYSVTCPVGSIPDKINSDGTFTCQRAPGKGRRIKCVDIYKTLESVYCPKYMYANSWATEGLIKRVRCCGERQLKYSEDSCDFTDATLDQDVDTAEGKFMPGFESPDGGLLLIILTLIFIVMKGSS